MPSPPDVTVYWRPGCFFCASLIGRLDGAAIRYRAVNIWDDPHAAAFVRSVADGNETVPTVTIGDTALVNPSFSTLTAALDAA
jgi:mycoredoxin